MAKIVLLENVRKGRLCHQCGAQ